MNVKNQKQLLLNLSAMTRNELIKEIKHLNIMLGIPNNIKELHSLTIQELQIVINCKFADLNYLLSKSK
jgi:hypothetical protein